MATSVPGQLVSWAGLGDIINRDEKTFAHNQSLSWWAGVGDMIHIAGYYTQSWKKPLYLVGR